VVDARGRIGIAHNTPQMAWAVWGNENKSAGVVIEA
jgi:hypothetical protein